MSMDSTPCTLSDGSSVSLIPDKGLSVRLHCFFSCGLIFSSCYLDQIEDDTEEEDTESIDSDVWSRNPTRFLPNRLKQPEDLTSLNSSDFIEYMNRIGWPQGGTFSTLLSTVGYNFHEENRYMKPKWHENKVADALILLILELYVPSTIVITSSESAIKNTDYPSTSWEDQTFKFR